jgi:MFS family permease
MSRRVSEPTDTDIEPITPPPARVAPAQSEFLSLFAAVMLPMFLAAVDQTLLATATPRIASEFGNLSDTSWIAVGYLLAATIAAPVYGRTGDRYGRRNSLLAALGVFAVGSIGCGVAPSMGALIAARILQGLGGGGLMVLSQALIGELVAPIVRARYQGYFAIVFTASSVGGPLLGGLVVHYADWRWLFFANLPLCALAAWRVSRLPVTERQALQSMPTDPWGLLLFVITACSALSWLSLAGHRFPWLSTTSAALLVAAVGTGVILMRQQRRHPSPFLPLDLLRLPGAPWICATVACFAATMFALVFLLPIYLQLGHGASASDAGLRMLPLTGGLVLGSTLNSRITVRTSIPSLTPPYGMAAAAIALAALALAPATVWGTIVATAIVGLGLGTVMPSAQLTMQVLAGRARLGAAAALLSLTRSCGASLGTALFGGLVFALLKVSTGGVEGAPLTLSGLAPEHVDNALKGIFASLAALMALGSWVATRVPRTNLAPTA